MQYQLLASFGPNEKIISAALDIYLFILLQAKIAGPEAFTKGIPEGIRRVMRGNFAYLLTRDMAQKFVNMYPDEFFLIDTNMLQVNSYILNDCYQFSRSV